MTLPHYNKRDDQAESTQRSHLPSVRIPNVRQDSISGPNTASSLPEAPFSGKALHDSGILPLAQSEERNRAPQNLETMLDQALIHMNDFAGEILQLEEEEAKTTK